MSNEVINPYQTFRDEKGVPLAAGGLRVYVNRTTTLGTAFSDSNLNVTQTVNPYRLDNFGRVQADLKWSGQRTVEAYNARDELIRTYNDVVTAVDTAGFAINFASLAAMAADTTLIAGDVAETQSYNANQDQGGARYIIEADTATVDNYRVIDLAPAGLQAKLLDIEENNNFYAAGAVGDGAVDDSAAVQRLLTIGGDIECANGVFLVDSLTLALSARIFGDGTLLHAAFTTIDMLTLSGTDKFLLFDGVTVDGNSDNQTSTAAIASINSTVTATSGNVSLVSFNNVTFQNGAEHDVRADGSDNGFPVLFGFNECQFLGGLEATDAPYLPACIHLSDGVSSLIEDSYFDLTTTPALVGGRIGVLASASGALTNPGYMTLSGSTFNRMGANANAANIRGAVYLQDLKSLIVGANRFISPQSAAIVFGAEVDVVQINGNMADGLTGTNKLAAITGLVTTRAAAGNHWKVEANQLVGIDGVAINVDGASAGADAADVAIDGNIIDSPTAIAILIENLNGYSVSENQINMANAVGINAIQTDADGVSGVCDYLGNQIINVDGTAILSSVVSSGAIFNVDGNPIESVETAIDIQNGTSAFITNNPIVDASVGVIDVGTLTNATLAGNSYSGTVPTNYARNLGGITNLVVGENLWPTVDTSILTVAGAAMAITSHFHQITDTTAVTSATFGADVIGFMVTILATVSVTITDGATLILVGSANYNMTATDTLTLSWNGTAFVEVARSVN